MSRVFAPRSAPDISRQQLPKLHLRVYWDTLSGLYVSLHGPALSGQIDDFSRSAPFLLQDDEIWKAFMPVVVRNQGPLFGRLNISDLELSKLIVERNSMYHLSEEVAKSWYLLEHNLIDIIAFLHPRHPHVADKGLSFPPFPHQFGYRDTHRSHRSAFYSARNARESFSTLSALVTFFLSIFLNSDALTPFDNVFYDLTRKSNPIPVAFLTSLESSYACDLRPSSRRGCFLNAYTTKWSGFFEKFVSAGVPVWLIWEDADGTRPQDPEIMKFFPPNDLISLAKARFQAVSELTEDKLERIMQTAALSNMIAGAAVDANRDWDQDLPDATGHFTPEDSSRLYQEAEKQDAVSLDVGEEGGFSSGIPEAGSGQRYGEVWQDFFQRMELEREEYLRNESRSQRTKRLNYEAVYNQTRAYTNRSKVFIWKPHFGFWRRILLESKADVEHEWDQSTEHQRRYMSHVNEWDICLQMEAYPPGTQSPLLQDDGNLPDEEFNFLYTKPVPKQTSIPTPPRPHAFSLLPSAKALLDAFTSFSNPPSLDFYRNVHHRYGFRLELHETFTPTSQIKHQASSYEDVLKFLGWTSENSTDNGHAHKFVDFFHAISQEKLCLRNLPSFFDMSPLCPLKLKLDQRRFFLRRYQSNGGSLYLIMPPAAAEDQGSWVIATSFASTVLHIYRSGPRSLREAAQSLLTVGACFHTAIETRITSLSPSQGVEEAIGLGYRPDSYEPTAEDLEIYLMKLKEVLASSAGRALRLRGGLVGRLARELVTDEEVLLGPISGKTLLTLEGSNIAYVDDVPSPNVLLVVCGVFIMSSRTGIQQLSWWPQESAWSDSGLASDTWTPAAEQYYQERWQDIRDGTAKLFSSSVWRKQLRRFKRVISPIRERVERISEEFISEAF
ncbi:hypothetical protein CVT26_014330 [Gymnopilus dilepis]|uniref:Uncharacterized protein n=1 Tax=Gymnopilus dilepis TaxID=231916 RepID=A0A409WTT9_9AGAR|nr:hypothetical protein CVT26_014330 [Gymnopilus dilepis]